MTSQFIEQFISEWKAQKTRTNLDLVMRVHSRIERETQLHERDDVELTEAQARLIFVCQKIMSRWSGYISPRTSEHRMVSEEKMRELAQQFAEYGGGLVADFGIDALEDNPDIA